ncbi:MAG: STAS domain-containing protein [Actinocatenispora sp.]
MTTHEIGTCRVVTVAGEIDAASRAMFRAALVKAISRAPVVVVDLSEVSFIDLRGVGELVLCARSTAKVGGRLLVAAADPLVVGVVRASGAADELRFYPSVSVALGTGAPSGHDPDAHAPVS